MSKVAITKEKITAVADAIREKAGTAGEMTLDEMPTKIAEIETGGGEFEINDARYLFYYGGRLNCMDVFVKALNNVTDMQYMFANCTTGFYNVDVSMIDTKNVNSMAYMFAYCSNLKSLDLSNFELDNVKYMQSMFTSCGKLTSVVFSDNLNTSNLLNMSNMFNQCGSLESIDLSKFNTSSVTNMSSMFQYCGKLKSVDLSNFDTTKTTDMSYMFNSCSALESIIGFSASNKAGMSLKFPYGNKTLKRLTFRTDLPEGTYSIRSNIIINNCAFERSGMVEMFNTLPDISGLSIITNKITITGNPCITGTLADGTACETLTDEDRAIATNKGWTLVE